MGALKPHLQKLATHTTQLKRLWLMLQFSNSPAKSWLIEHRLDDFEIETAYDSDAYYLANFREFGAIYELDAVFDKLAHENKPPRRRYAFILHLLATKDGRVTADDAHAALRSLGSSPADFGCPVGSYTPYPDRVQRHPMFDALDTADSVFALPLTTLMRRDPRKSKAKKDNTLSDEAFQTLRASARPTYATLTGWSCATPRWSPSR